MSLRTLILTFVLLWLVSALATWNYFGAPSGPGTFGDMFGAVNALFSGVALAMAIYSLILQQRQTISFERSTLETLDLLKRDLQRQSEAARVMALIALIDSDRNRIEQLEAWGEQQGDRHKYRGGIDAAEKRIQDYRKQIEEIGASDRAA